MFYNRRVELENVVAEKKEADEKKLTTMLEQTRFKADYRASLEK